MILNRDQSMQFYLLDLSIEDLRAWGSPAQTENKQTKVFKRLSRDINHVSIIIINVRCKNIGYQKQGTEVDTLNNIQ